MNRSSGLRIWRALALVLAVAAEPCDELPPIQTYGYGPLGDAPEEECIYSMREELSKVMSGLGELIMFANETRLVCGVTPSAKHIGYGCKVLSRLGWQILARALRFLRPCTRMQEDEQNQ